jgi:hypothetical protein
MIICSNKCESEEAETLRLTNGRKDTTRSVSGMYLAVRLSLGFAAAIESIQINCSPLELGHVY